MRAKLLATITLCMFFGAGCSVKESGHGDNKDVDIKTPLGQMAVHTNDNVNTKATGLAPYPGAVQIKDEDGDKGADVNMSFGGFGLKVAALKFRTDDPQDKVTAFYRKDLEKYGAVLTCDPAARREKATEGSDRLTCSDKGDSGGMNINISEDKDNGMELKAGTKHKQHIVSITRDGTGTKFSLVSVEMHLGKDEQSM
jgi:hypothetical protein